MNKEEIVYLVIKSLQEELTDMESQDLKQWLNEHGENSRLFEAITNKTSIQKSLRILEQYEAEKETKWKKVSKFGLKIEGSTVKIFSLQQWKHAAIVAAIAIGIFVLCFNWSTFFSSDRMTAIDGNINMDLGPGGNKAVLMLGNGKIIYLNDVGIGQLTEQNNTDVLKLDSGELAYTVKKPVDNVNNLVFNKLMTPRGGQYRITLSDGSRLWLNSESSIRFPVAFNGSERRIEVTGEVYLEVSHDVNKPFRVVAGQNIITVIGTAFNLNTYKDEPALTVTLFSGSIELDARATGKYLKLAPNQQAIIPNNPQLEVKVDTLFEPLNVIAWKEGYFAFKNEGIPAIMRQLARWYDLEIDSVGASLNLKFTGKLHRNTNAINILRVLKSMGLNFKTQGRRISVYQ